MSTSCHFKPTWQQQLIRPQHEKCRLVLLLLEITTYYLFTSEVRDVTVVSHHTLC